eukprot:4340937-Prymnesium_polylepis.1
MGNWCAKQDAEPMTTIHVVGGSQMGGSNSSAKPGNLQQDLAAHYTGAGIRYFVAHLVNSDLSKARPLILEISASGVAFAHPKAPFKHFKTFDFDEIVGWKASEAEFSLVTLR